MFGQQPEEGGSEPRACGEKSVLGTKGSMCKGHEAQGQLVCLRNFQEVSRARAQSGGSGEGVDRCPLCLIF